MVVGGCFGSIQGWVGGGRVGSTNYKGKDRSTADFDENKDVEGGRFRSNKMIVSLFCLLCVKCVSLSWIEVIQS